MPYKNSLSFKPAIAFSAVCLILAGCDGGSTDTPTATAPVVVPPLQGITKIVIDPAKSETVTFGGTTFGAVGTYQKIRGIAYGQLDPNDPKNQVIADMPTGR